ncbi:hypothetical protein [Psychrobacter sp. AH5]
MTVGWSVSGIYDIAVALENKVCKRLISGFVSFIFFVTIVQQG